MQLKKNLILSAVVVLLLIMNIKQCSEPTKTKTMTVEVPQETGSFKLNPNLLQWPVIYKDSIVYKTEIKDSIIYIENEVNTKLAEDYKALKSEFDRYQLFLDAIKLQNYSKTFEDDLLSATISGKVQGNIQDMALDYSLKPRTIKKDIQVKNYRFVVGPQVGVTYLSGDFVPYVGVGLTYRVIRF